MFVFENQDIKLLCNLSDNGTLSIEGTMVLSLSTVKSVEIFATNPIQRTGSFMGSAMPYPNADIAFDNTPNRYNIVTQSFYTKFWYPNSYYTADAREKVLPSLFIKITHIGSENPTYYRFELPDPFQLRTATHRSDRKGPEFYKVRRDQLGVQSQEALLRTYGKPYLY